MAISASQLRKDVYRLLDEVLTTGRSLEIERNGQLLRLVPAATPSRLANVGARPDLVAGDAGDLVSMDWSPAWRP